MKTKKFFLVALTVLCAMTMTSVFTACGSDDDKDDVKTFSYAITFDFHSFASSTEYDPTNPNASADGGFSDWMNSILNSYRSALGTSTDQFTKTGTQGECDKQVYEACKKAEETVKDIRGGSATVAVTNTTTGKQVYSYQVQP